MYHEDRLGGGGFARVVLAGASLAGPEQAERLRRGIEERVGGRVELVDVRRAAAMRDRITRQSRRCSTRWRRRSACSLRERAGQDRPGGLMLRTNLSTRPFYNERLVHLVLALVAVLVVAVTVLNVVHPHPAVAAEHDALGAIRDDRTAADDFARRARETRQGIDQNELKSWWPRHKRPMR